MVLFVLTCSVSVRNGAEGSLPLLPDAVQHTSRELWLSLHVERLEETLPDGLPGLTLAPERYTK